MTLTKRILSVLLSLCTVFQITGTFAEAPDASEYVGKDNIASVTLGKEVKKNKIETINILGNRTPLVKTADGKEGWVLGTGSKGSVYVNLANSFAKSITDGTRFTIEIDYYNKSAQGIYVVYDSLVNNGTRSTPNEVIGIEPRKNKWLTASFEIDDAYFGDRVPDWESGVKYDFYVKCPDNKEVYVSEIRIIKHKENRPINISELSSPQLGHVYGNGEAKTFNYTVSNLIDKDITAQVTYRVLDEYNQTVWSSDGGEMVLKAKGDISGSVTADMETRYGIFDFEMELTGDDFKIFRKVPFSSVNTLPEGEVNKYYGVNIHPTLGSPKIDDIIHVLNESGSGILRAALGQWSDFVGKDSDDFIPSGTMRTLYEAYKNTNAEFALPMRAHTRYDTPGQSGEGRMITTEEEFEARRLFNINYNDYVKENGNRIAFWSLWNEPNLPQYNKGTVEETADYVVNMAKAIKKDIPDATVMGIGLTMLESSTSQKHWNAAVDKGLLDLIDAVDVHYYYGERHETSVGNKAYKEMHDRIKAKIGKDLPFVISEYGGYNYGTVTDSNKRLAEMMTRLYLWDKGTGLADYFIRYTLYDNNRSWSEYGLMLSPDANEYIKYFAKEEFLSQVNINNMLQNADVERKVLENKDNKCAFIFRRPRDNAQVMPVWAYEGNAVLSFKCGAETLSISDIYGNKREITPVDGIYTIGLSESVRYIEGNLDNLEVVADTVSINTEQLTDLPKGYTANIGLRYLADAFAGANITAELYDETGKLAERETVFGDNSNIKLSTAEVTGDVCEIRLSCTKDSKEAFCMNIPMRLNTDSGITSSVVLGSLKSSNDLEHAKLKFYITNNGIAPVEGRIRIKEPKGFTDDTIKFKTIPGKSTALINTSTHSWGEFRSIDVEYDVVTSDGTVYPFEQNIGAIYLLRTDSAPKVDGIISDGEYNMETAYNLADEKNIIRSAGYTWDGPEDQSVKGVITYDDDNLYMVIDVTDDKFYVEGSRDANTIWMYDSMQLGFAASEWTLADTQIGGFFTQIEAGKLEDGSLYFERSMSEGNNFPTGKMANSEFAVNREGKHTIYEMRIGWDELVPNEFEISGDTTFKFSFIVNDNDGGGREGWIELTPGIGRVKDSTMFCTLSFVE